MYNNKTDKARKNKMKSAKEITTEAKILNKLKKYPVCEKLAKMLFDDVELQEMQDYANTVSIKRLGFNDHGPVHMKQVANNAIKMLNILHEAGIKTSLEREEVGTFEDSMCAVILAGLMHDLGMTVSRDAHEEMSVIFAKPVIEKVLLELFPKDIHKRVVIKALTIETIFGHMSSHRIHSIEAGIILIADGCDMTKGRARIPLAINSAPKVGDIHKYSAHAIEHVKINKGTRKPIKIEIGMSADVGFFQIEEVLLTKVNSSPAKDFVELYAGVIDQEYKCYI